MKTRKAEKCKRVFRARPPCRSAVLQKGRISRVVSREARLFLLSQRSHATIEPPDSAVSRKIPRSNTIGLMRVFHLLRLFAADGRASSDASPPTSSYYSFRASSSAVPATAATARALPRRIDCAMHIGTLTRRTLGRSGGAERDVPFVATSGASKMPRFRHGDRSSFNTNRPAVDQSPSNLLPCRLDDSAECLSRNTHLLRRLFLIQPQVVGQPQRLELVYGEHHFVQVFRGHSRRLEDRLAGHPCDATAALWSRHDVISRFHAYYEHMLITCQGGSWPPEKTRFPNSANGSFLAIRFSRGSKSAE